jgi:hypothetical protein
VNDADALVAADLAGLGGEGETLPGVGHDARPDRSGRRRSGFWGDG